MVAQSPSLSIGIGCSVVLLQCLPDFALWHFMQDATEWLTSSTQDANVKFLDTNSLVRSHILFVEYENLAFIVMFDAFKELFVTACFLILFPSCYCIDSAHVCAFYILDAVSLDSMRRLYKLESKLVT